MIRVLLISLLFPISFSGFTQTGADTTFLQASIQNSLQFYERAVAGQVKLHNGSRYLAPAHTVDQHPYFFSYDWIMGDVFYDGELFTNVPLMYDILNSIVITEHHSNGQPVQLLAEKLDFFSIAGHHFEKIENKYSGSPVPSSGFFDILYPGKTKVIARRQKVLHEKIISQQIEISYDEKTRYFVLKNGHFFQVKSIGSVLKILGDKKQDLKKFLIKNRSSFSANRALAIKSLAQYYDKLNTEEK